MRGFIERATRQDLPIDVGVPVYYTLPPREELRMGRVARIDGNRAQVIRDGKREYVEVEWCTVAKRELKETRHGNAG